MKREFLESLGLEKEVIDKIMAENLKKFFIFIDNTNAHGIIMKVNKKS